MPTILDSLVVELGLDPTKLNKGQQQALASFKKTQEEALKSGKAIEGAAQRVTQYLGSMRNQAVGFAAAAFGANGIIDFIKQVTTSNAALGRTAPILGTTVEKLSVWRNAVKLAGGTAEGMQQTIAGLVSSFARFGITGQMPEAARWFEALGIRAADATGKLKPFDKLMFELSEKVSKMDPVFGAEFLRGARVDESMIPFLLKGPAAMREYLDTMEKTAKVTKEAADKSAELERKWVELSEAAKGIGINIVEFFTPAIQKIIGVFGHYLGGIGENINKIKGQRSEWDALTPEQKEKKLADEKVSLRVKSNAGTPSVAISALASSLQSSIPGLKEFTSFNDPFHAGMKSKHAEGLALDFTVADRSKYAETAAAVRRRLTEMGIPAYVRDEHNDPSPYATGSHIHVQFANAAAANKFSTMSGAGGAAAISNAGVSSGGATNSTVINGGITVNMNGGDAEDVRQNLGEQITRKGISCNAQTGAC